MSVHGESDAYRILQIDPDADEFVLEAAYRALARHYHPDGKTPDTERMAAINRAYDLIRTADRRRRYDANRLNAVGPEPVVATRAKVEPWTMGSAKREAEHASSSVLDFGRYRGWRLRDLARQDPDYLRWLARHASGFRYRSEILELLAGDQELQRRAKSAR